MRQAEAGKKHHSKSDHSRPIYRQVTGCQVDSPASPCLRAQEASEARPPLSSLQATPPRHLALPQSPHAPSAHAALLYRKANRRKRAPKSQSLCRHRRICRKGRGERRASLVSSVHRPCVLGIDFFAGIGWCRKHRIASEMKVKCREKQVQIAVPPKRYPPSLAAECSFGGVFVPRVRSFVVFVSSRRERRCRRRQVEKEHAGVKAYSCEPF